MAPSSPTPLLPLSFASPTTLLLFNPQQATTNDGDDVNDGNYSKVVTEPLHHHNQDKVGSFYS